MNIFNTKRMPFAICVMDNNLHKLVALACCVSVELARSLATAMANDLNLSEYYSPNKRPVLYVYDDKGRNYGSF